MNGGGLNLQFDPQVLVGLIQGLPENHILEYGGHRLQVQSKGRLHKWKWVWDAQVKDLTTGIQGSSRHYKSRGGAIEHAVEDLMGRNL